MKTTSLFIALAVLIMTAAVGGMAPPSWAQSGKMPKLINPNLNPRISDHMVDEQDPNTYRGRWTGLTDDVIYVDHAPFRITPATTLVAEGGYETIGLIFEEDRSAEVKFTPDVATGGEGIPLALHVRIYPGQKQ